ncbi:hypothetical protein BC828DRAFT_372530 [Blastocladiella britannica]|nr:hypothetical protein BC828DRAFT_372530 [Blastocladiella britannica]
MDDPLMPGTLVLEGLVILLAVGSGSLLFKRAFPSIYLPTESSMRFIAIRCRLLFVLSLLCVADAANTLTHHFEDNYQQSIGEQLSDSAFLRFRILWMITFLPCIELLTIANAMRCAIIIMQNPRIRRQYLLVVASVSVTAHGGITVGCILRLVEVMKMPPDERAAVAFLPWYASAMTAFFPVAIVGGSAWSLWMSSTTTVSVVAAPTSIMSGGARIASTSSSGSTSSGPPHQLSLPSTRLSSRLTSLTAGTASAFRAVLTRPASGGSSSASRSGPLAGSGISYKMCTAFTVLTVAETIIWIGATWVAFAPLVPGVHSPALVTLLSALCIVVEGSFEWLVKVQHARSRARLVNVNRFMETALAIVDGNDRKTDNRRSFSPASSFASAAVAAFTRKESTSSHHHQNPMQQESPLQQRRSSWYGSRFEEEEVTTEPPPPRRPPPPEPQHPK